MVGRARAGGPGKRRANPNAPVAGKVFGISNPNFSFQVDLIFNTIGDDMQVEVEVPFMTSIFGKRMLYHHLSAVVSVVVNYLPWLLPYCT